MIGMFKRTLPRAAEGDAVGLVVVAVAVLVVNVFIVVVVVVVVVLFGVVVVAVGSPGLFGVQPPSSRETQRRAVKCSNIFLSNTDHLITTFFQYTTSRVKRQTANCSKISFGSVIFVYCLLR